MKKSLKQKFLMVTAVFIGILILATSCPAGDDGEDRDEFNFKPNVKYRIKNWETGTLNNENTFLFDNSGILAIQAEAENDAQFWFFERKNGKRLIKNVASGNYLNMAGVSPSWGGDEAAEGRAKVSPFADTQDFYWEFFPGSGDKEGSMQIFTNKEWPGTGRNGKALLSLNSIAHLEGAEPGNTSKLDAFKGTVQCRNDLDASGLGWGTCFWVYYAFE